MGYNNSRIGFAVILVLVLMEIKIIVIVMKFSFQNADSIKYGVITAFRRWSPRRHPYKEVVLNCMRYGNAMMVI